MKFICLWVIFLLGTTGLVVGQKNNNYVVWDKTIKLQLRDFTIVKNSQAIPPSLGNNQAISRTGFSYSISNYTSGSNKGKVQISIYAAFYKDHSYMLQQIITAPAKNIAYLLNHEQNHFDISEIYAREACRQLRELRLTKDYTNQVTVLMKRVFKEAAAYQEKYDQETNNGRNQKMQEDWNKNINARLISLNAYAAKNLLLTIYK